MPALSWAGGAFAMDPLLERALEAGGSAALGARVEVGGLRTRVFPPFFYIQQMSSVRQKRTELLVQLFQARIFISRHFYVCF